MINIKALSGRGMTGFGLGIKRAYNMPRQPEPGIAQNISSLGAVEYHTPLWAFLEEKKYHVLTLHANQTTHMESGVPRDTCMALQPGSFLEYVT